MKLSTALFVSLVAICCTVTSIYGQIIFSDGTSQTTSFNGAKKPRPQSQYYERITFQSSNYAESTLIVPNGKELVIYRVTIPGLEVLIMSQSATDVNDTFNLMWYQALENVNFPDGLVVIDEGRRLLLETRQLNNQSANVLGYLRDKVDFHPHAPSRYTEVLTIPVGAPLSATSSFIVPTGEELVVLEIHNSTHKGIYLSVSDVDANDIVMLYETEPAPHRLEFPEGAIVVNEGRKIQWEGDGASPSQTKYIGILGFLRRK